MKSQQDGEPARPDLEVGVTHLEKMAQGQDGFQVGTFELPQVQRNNVDEDLRHRSEQTWAAANAGGASRQGGGTVSRISNGGSASRSSSGGSWQSSSGQQSSGTRTSGGGGGGGGSYTYSSSSQGGNAGGHTGGHIGGSTGHRTMTSGGSTGSHTNQHVSYDDDDDYSFDEYDNIEDEYSSHNVEDTNKQHGGKKHDKTDEKFKHYQRFRRQAYYDQDDTDADLKRALQCSASRCAILRCVAGPLLHQKEGWIAMRTRLVASTMQKIASGVPLTTSTMTVARINKLPYIGTPKERPIRTHELQVKATPEPIAAPDVVPLWVVVLAACAGTIILLLLIYLLYKVSEKLLVLSRFAKRWRRKH
jgi:integrin alpha 8